jgi:hypothetical protein
MNVYAPALLRAFESPYFGGIGIIALMRENL